MKRSMIRTKFFRIQCPSTKSLLTGDKKYWQEHLKSTVTISPPLSIQQANKRQEFIDAQEKRKLKKEVFSGYGFPSQPTSGSPRRDRAIEAFSYKPNWFRRLLNNLGFPSRYGVK
jgi:hypothetical protein